jgi:endonuclease YncB( thermonuclease family)
MKPMQVMKRIGLVLAAGLLAACSLDVPAAPTVSADLYTVVNVIDGDTIDVRKDGQTYRVRYIGVNTPERDEVCYDSAKEANERLVEGQQVRLERDTSETDRYDRLLRFVYVGDTFVNETLVREGWAEAVLYLPDRAQFSNFSGLEREAARAGRGCHPTGIFDDGNNER